MNLRIITPLEVVVDQSEVVSVRAEDASGAFGILSGHTDFLTVLSVSVLSWTRRDGSRSHAAVHGGVMEVRGGERINVASREAVVGSSLPVLRDEVLARFRAEAAFDEVLKTSSARLSVALIRQLQRYLQAGRAGGSARGMGSLGDGA